MAMKSSTPQIRTGRTTTFIVSLMAVLITAVLGVGQFLGLSSGLAFTLIESIALTSAGLALLAEITMEGSRKGIMNRDWSPMDIVGAVFGLGVVATGVTGLIGQLAGTPMIGMPPVVKGTVMMIPTALLARELFTK